MWRLKFSVVKLRSTSTNPRCLTPTLAWHKWIVKLDDGSLVRIGSLGVMWLWCQWWVCLIHPERWEIYSTKLDETAYQNHVILLRDPSTRSWVKKRPGDDELIKQFEAAEKALVVDKSETLGIAAYSNDHCPPIANFSSKKVFDCCDREIMVGNFVRVDGKIVVQVTEDGTGDLVFSPYDKEELVRAYWMNSLEVVVPVSKDRLCACANRKATCPIDPVMKDGFMWGCGSREISSRGITVVDESEIKNDIDK